MAQANFYITNFPFLLKISFIILGIANLHYTQKVLKRDADGHFHLWKGIIAGMTAGALGQFIASPTDLVKVQMQLEGKSIVMGNPPKYRGTLHAFQCLLQQGGLRGLWRGWGPNCQRAALVQLGDMTTYDNAKQVSLPFILTPVLFMYALLYQIFCKIIARG